MSPKTSSGHGCIDLTEFFQYILLNWIHFSRTLKAQQRRSAKWKLPQKSVNLIGYGVSHVKNPLLISYD
jgi:hypothetical protein